MTLMRATNIHVSFATLNVLKGVDIEINDGAVLGIVGINGCGKSTLMRVLAGDISPTQGYVHRYRQDLEVKYLSQVPQFESATVYEELIGEYKNALKWQERMHQLEELMAEGHATQSVLSEYSQLQEKYQRAGGYTYQIDIARALANVGWGEDYYSQRVSTLSGGEKTRLELARLLLCKPDVLLLDEPTNYMDIEGMGWLAQFVKDFRGAVAIISHDRYFLDEVATEIVEIHEGKAYRYRGNYSRYVQQKQEMIESQRELYRQQKKRAAQLRQVVHNQMSWFHRAHDAAGTCDSARRMAAKHATLAQTKQKQLDRLEARMIKPLKEAPKLKVNFDLDSSIGAELFVMKNMNKRFEKRTLFENVEMMVPTGSKIGLLGANGSGKTTLIRMLLGEDEPSEGEILLGKSVRPAYFDQEMEYLNLSRSAVEELLHTTNLKPREAMLLLSYYQIHGDKAQRPMHNLSLGERIRVSLTKLLVCGANMLILDEPTNHLDIPSRESLEFALNEFPGSLLLVSHDRYFLDKAIDTVIYIEDCQLHLYPGNYSEFMRYKERRAELDKVVNPELYMQLQEQVAQLEMHIAHLGNLLQQAVEDSDEKAEFERTIAEEYRKLYNKRKELEEMGASC